MRLSASILQRHNDQTLLNERVAPIRRERWDHHEFTSEEIWTPGGLPLRLTVTFGVRETFEVWTATTLLFRTTGMGDYFSFQLWLPTDEVLDVHLGPSPLSERTIG